MRFTPIPVTFTYQVELVETRPYWSDKTVSVNTLSNTVQYDSLKKVYRYSAIGRNVQRKVITRNPNRYKELMSTLKEAPIASIRRLNPESTYYLRVKADVETDRLWFPFNYIFCLFIKDRKFNLNLQNHFISSLMYTIRTKESINIILMVET